jgi:hypothetical protein
MMAGVEIQKVHKLDRVPELLGTGLNRNSQSNQSVPWGESLVQVAAHQVEVGTRNTNFVPHTSFARLMPNLQTADFFKLIHNPFPWQFLHPALYSRHYCNSEHYPASTQRCALLQQSIAAKLRAAPRSSKLS